VNPALLQMKSLLCPAVLALAIATMATAEDPYSRARVRLIAQIKGDVTATRRELGKKELAPKVFDVLERVPRHEFVPPSLRRYAYDNRPLPIGYGQTISQPYIVAIMTDLLHPNSDDVVLEVGTGSGYQAAVLAELVAKVYTVEIIPELAAEAKERLERLDYGNVVTRTADGYYGWEEHAPFDAVIVTAAAGHIPPPLIEQLKPGGKMIIPVGGPFSVQQLMLLEKTETGTVKSRQVLPVSFVPLTGER
jgi:protein-L-isoaspartate(D-aspartate) O-methyltransferase